MKYQNQKTGIRYGKRLKKKKRIQTYPIKLENNDLPSGQDRAEAFVYLFAENSLSSNFSPLILFKKNRYEEQKEDYQDAILGQCHHFNSPLQCDNFLELLESFASNTTTVGMDGIFHIKCCTIFLLVGNSYQTHILPTMFFK